MLVDHVAWLVVPVLVWSVPLTLAHELGHAACALELGAEEALVTIGTGPRVARIPLGRVTIELRLVAIAGGTCQYDGDSLRRARADAWVAAAGPLATLFCLSLLATSLFATEYGSLLWQLLAGGAIYALLMFLVTAIPVTYGSGLKHFGDESDGRAVWRILTGSVRRGRVVEASPARDRVARRAFVVVALVVAGVAFAVAPASGAALLLVLGLAYLLQRASA